MNAYSNRRLNELVQLVNSRSPALSGDGVSYQGGVKFSSASPFDAFVSIAEKFSEELTPHILSLIPRVKLFTLEDIAQDFLPKYLGPKEEWMEEKGDEFFLPFPVTAVQDPAGCVILFDDPTADDCIGLDKPRAFLNITSVFSDPDLFKNAYKTETTRNAYMEMMQQATDAGLPGDTVSMVAGIFKGIQLNAQGKWEMGGYCQRVLLANKKEVVLSTDVATDFYLGKGSQEEGSVSFTNSVLNDVLTAIQEVQFINDPRHFILETINEKAHERFQRKFGNQKKKKKKRYARRFERPTYTVLKPKKIRKLMGLPDLSDMAEGRSRTPHYRRAHTRLLTADRYKDKKGKRVFVKSCWIGPSEARVEGKKYRVLLDR